MYLRLVPKGPLLKVQNAMQAEVTSSEVNIFDCLETAVQSVYISRSI